MTNSTNSTITPEIEAKWRAEFEKYISSPPHEMDISRFSNYANHSWPGAYRDINVHLAWDSWLAARSTVIIQPSETIIHSDGKLYTEILHIESQGYRVRSEA